MSLSENGTRTRRRHRLRRQPCHRDLAGRQGDGDARAGADAQERLALQHRADQEPGRRGRALRGFGRGLRQGRGLRRARA